MCVARTAKKTRNRPPNEFDGRERRGGCEAQDFTVKCPTSGPSPMGSLLGPANRYSE